jgi:hypothetical protein
MTEGKLPPALIYIAGSYRALSPALIAANIRRAEETALIVASFGAYPVCPHLNTGLQFNGIGSDQMYLEGTMELMRRCDAVLLVNGDVTVSSSIGTAAELLEAKRMQKNVFDDIDDLSTWLDARDSQ